MGLFRRTLRFFFHHFYHGFSWTYDLIAAVVSLGRWNAWVASVLPFIHGSKVLEIGHGPGYLQFKLVDGKRAVVGLDESKQMGILARRRLVQAGIHKFNLIRGRGELLPFAAGSFDSVVSTFPTEYIFDNQTLTEIYRVLQANGLLLVIPAAWIVGKGFLDRSAAWLFKITGQAPAHPQTSISHRLKPLFENAGFIFETRTLEIRSSMVLLLIAKKQVNGR